MVVRDPALEGVGETPWSVRAVLTNPEGPGSLVPGVAVVLVHASSNTSSGASFIPLFSARPSAGPSWRRSGSSEDVPPAALAGDVLRMLGARRIPVPEADSVLRLLGSARRQAFLAAVRSLAALSGPAVSPEDAGCAWAEVVLAEEVHSS